MSYVPARLVRRALLALPGAALAQSETTLARMARTGEFRILADEDDPPFSMAGPDGFEIALGRALAEQLGCRPVFSLLPRLRLLGALREGQGDAVVSGVVVSAATARRVRFAAATGARSLAVVARPGAAIGSEAAFAGRVVAGSPGVYGASVVVNLMARWGASLSVQASFEECMRMVEQGEALAAIVETYDLPAYRMQRPDAPPVEIVYRTEPAPVAPVVRLADEDLVAALNIAIAKLWRNGVIEDLYLRFTGEAVPYLGDY